MSLDKVVKEKNELRNSNSQLKHWWHRHDLRASKVCLEGKTLSPIAVGLNLILWMTK